MAALILLLLLTVPVEPPAVDFAVEVLPLLSDRCFACHGPDEDARQAGLRLDDREAALAPRRGGPALVPGDAAASALIERLTSSDPEHRMPPPGTRRPLSEEEVARVARWIDQGAQYTPHWSLRPPRAAGAELTGAEDPGLLVDHFVRKPLAYAGLGGLSAPGDPALVARRTALALTGLPPSPERVDRLVQDLEREGEPAWSAYVDELLHDPGFGEHWARWWLDMARYADTKGYEADRRRTAWPWRDWVVGAFDEGLPFDRFTELQLAGDLLPGATPDQRLATAFHRNTMTNDEGGTDDEEFRAAAVADRVDTTMEVWTGLTASCARCHSHKFDPLSQREYFQLYAVFDQTADADRMDDAPLLEVPDPDTAARLAELDARDAALERQLAAWLADQPRHLPAPATPPQIAPDGPWLLAALDEALPPGAEPDGGDDLTWLEDGAPLPPRAGDAAGSDAPGPAPGAGDRPAALRPRSGRRAWVVSAPDGGTTHQRFFTGAEPPLEIEAGDWLVAHFWIDPTDPPRELMLQWHTTDGSWEHRIAFGEHVIPWGQAGTGGHRHLGDLPPAGRWVALELDPADVDLAPGDAIDGWAFSQVGGRVVWDRAGLWTARSRDPAWRHDQGAWEQRVAAGFTHGVPEALRVAAALPAAERGEVQAATLREHFLSSVWPPGRQASADWRAEREALAAERDALLAEVPRVPVLEELRGDARRTTRVHLKGDFRNPGEVVTPDVPAALPPWPADQPRDRRGLAAWLTAREHPLTARVLVNRVWERLFGAGLVRTSEDFGLQGERPSHPELLDALAVDLIDHGWDLRHLLRRLVHARTWRQSSAVTPRRLALDPENRLLGRAPRVRLDGETLRDQALAVAGLLDRTKGGPPVFPPQPEGVWRIVYNGDTWRTSEGADRHRRSLYTFWRRTSPYPAYTTFDAPSREVCVSRRVRTNTPLQALVTLNDPVFVEAAQALARRVWRERPDDRRGQLARMLRLALVREPTAAELETLEALVADERARLADAPQDARSLAEQPMGPLPTGADPLELAALTVAANVVLNLDELVMPR